MRMVSQSLIRSPQNPCVDLLAYTYARLNRYLRTRCQNHTPESYAGIIRQHQRNLARQTKPCAWFRFPAIPKSNTPAIPKSAAMAIPSLSLTHSHTRALKTQSLSPHKVQGVYIHIYTHICIYIHIYIYIYIPTNLEHAQYHMYVLCYYVTITIMS